MPEGRAAIWRDLNSWENAPTRTSWRSIRTITKSFTEGRITPQTSTAGEKTALRKGAGGPSCVPSWWGSPSTGSMGGISKAVANETLFTSGVLCPAVSSPSIKKTLTDWNVLSERPPGLLVKYWNKCPERLGDLHPWEYSKFGWTRPQLT